MFPQGNDATSIPSQCCALPPIVNGELHYNCSVNPAVSNDFGCYNNNGQQWVTCQQPYGTVLYCTVYCQVYDCKMFWDILYRPCQKYCCWTHPRSHVLLLAVNFDKQLFFWILKNLISVSLSLCPLLLKRVLCLSSWRINVYLVNTSRSSSLST